MHHIIPIKRAIKTYVSKDGKEHFHDWLDSISDAKNRQRIKIRVTRMEIGNFGDYKLIGQGIYEARFHFGPGYRLYFGLDGLNLILLLCGGDKKTQPSDIENALLYWNDYKGRT